MMELRLGCLGSDALASAMAYVLSRLSAVETVKEVERDFVIEVGS